MLVSFGPSIVLTIKGRRTVDDLTFLNSLPLFTGIPASDLESIHRMCRQQRYKPGAVILRQGDAGADLYIVREGEVAVRLRTGGEERDLVRLGAGSMFGEMSLFDGY